MWTLRFYRPFTARSCEVAGLRHLTATHLDHTNDNPRIIDDDDVIAEFGDLVIFSCDTGYFFSTGLNIHTAECEANGFAPAIESCAGIIKAIFWKFYTQ